MRLYLTLTAGKRFIPFNYQSLLTGAIHKWIGPSNEYHGRASLYSFSWLQQVNVYQSGLKTRDNSYFFISAYSIDLLKKILTGIQDSPELFFGIAVREVQIKSEPSFSSGHLFSVASPVLIKKKLDRNTTQHVVFNDPESGTLLTESLRKKMQMAGLSADGVKVFFDTSHSTARTKIIHYKEIGNRVNLCPIRMQGTPEQIAFAWNVGIGHSTGIGFGALK